MSEIQIGSMRWVASPVGYARLMRASEASQTKRNRLSAMVAVLGMSHPAPAPWGGLADYGHDVVDYGDAVLDALIGAGGELPAIYRAAIDLWNVELPRLSAAIAPVTKSDVAEVVDFSKGREGSRSSPGSGSLTGGTKRRSGGSRSRKTASRS